MLDKVDEGIAQHAEARRLNPDGFAGRNLPLSLNPAYIGVYFHLADLLGKRGRIDQALEFLRHVAKMKPDSARTHFVLGVAELQHGDVNEAAGHLTIAAQLDPNSPETYYNLAQALSKQGKAEQAVAAYRQAFALWPQYVEAHIALADMLLAAGEPDEAVVHYQQALKLRPDDQPTREKLAEAQNLLNQNP